MRAIVFFLASLSFACLLGQFYELWTMHLFGCWVLPPAALLLVGVAWRHRRSGTALDKPAGWIVHGALGGLVAAGAYDLYRLPFVLQGAPLFQVFPQFGELLLGAPEPRGWVMMLGWGYHFSNGAALGIMFLTLTPRLGTPWLGWGAVAWALCVECALLLTPYATFFGLPLNGRFLFLTASAHLVFGVALGAYMVWVHGRRGRRGAGGA